MTEFVPRILRRDEIDLLFEQAYRQLEERRVSAEMNAVIVSAVAGIDDPLLASDRGIAAVKALHRRLVDRVLARVEE